ncbi:hypothetical protein BGZ63DRAFT_393555 [Mariannaea sp. PMI_226]|nr:hypothetical protein BGZ63DRAFT_393555 [Mariannaea sp. PMI_226]
MEQNKPAKSLQDLLNEPKGKTTYYSNQVFLIHVFWEAPSIQAAQTVLDALRRCGQATHRDTPCVPTYHFRISSLDNERITGGPKTVGDHTQLQDSLKKLKIGVPRPAVLADLARRGIDPQLLDADPDTPLPSKMQQQPVMLEFTELYLDERAFFEHAGSRDYLDAYGLVMQPGLLNKQATVRIGFPTAEITEKILEPMLKAKHEPIPSSCHLWRAPVSTRAGDGGVFLSMDATGSVDSVASSLPRSLREASTTCVAFAHPLQKDRIRVLVVLPELPSIEALQVLSGALVDRVEVHCQEKHVEVIGQMIMSLQLNDFVAIRATQSGYALHEKAQSVTELAPEST